MVHLFDSINWAHELPHTVKVPRIQRPKHDVNPVSSLCRGGLTWVSKQAPAHGRPARHQEEGILQKKEGKGR